MKKSLFCSLLILSGWSTFAQSFITEIGQTVYDLQTNATIGARVVADQYGISAVWTHGLTAPSFTDRGTGYNHWDPATQSWSAIPSSRLESNRTGWPSVVHTADGMEWVFSHNGNNIQAMKQDLINGGGWVEQGSIPTSAPESVIWNRACAGGVDGNTIHLIASTTYNGTFINGLDQQILYYRSQDAGATWDIVDMTFEGMSPPMWGFDGDTYAISANGNTVAVAIFGTLQDSYVWISNDNGSNWTRYVMNDFPIDNYQIDSGTDIDNDGVEDRITSTSTSGNVGVDNNGVVHVSFASMDYIDFVNYYDNQYNYFRASGEIKYWNSAMAGDPLDASDDFLITAGVAPGMIEGVNVIQEQLGVYGFGGLVNHPSIVLSESGEVFILYDAVKEGSLQGGLYRRHLFMVKSTDGGVTWSEPVDVSPNLDGNNWEYNFACAAPRVFDGKIHMTAQRDLVPGFSINASNDFGINSVVYVAVDATTLSTIINGCTDPAACNFSAEATQDDGSCILIPTDEICDGIDNDCNGEIDNGVLVTWYQDSDGDGFGSAFSGTWISCSAVPGYVSGNSDCDDNAFTYQDFDFDGFGGDNIVSCNGVYNSDDCNDLLNSVGNGDYYVMDADGDGYHIVDGYYFGCSAQPGYIVFSGDNMNQDCNDNDASVGPVNYYDYDNDGDGFSNWNISYVGCFAYPGYIAYTPGSVSDCDDYNYTYSDEDGDGFGSDILVACGGVYNSEDCDDDLILYQDIDFDGFGSTILSACSGSIVNTDCNDFDATSPTNAVTYYLDADGDGFGDPYNFFVTCDSPQGYVLNGDDCYPYSLTYQDLDGDYYGNGILAACGTFLNDDCDDNDPSINEFLFYLEDADSDGFGSFVNYYFGCPSEGFIQYTGSALQEDCDDNNSALLGTNIYTFDNDGDGFGSFTNYYVGCSILPNYLLYTPGLSQEDCDENNFTYADADGDGFGSDVLVGCNGLYNSEDCDDNTLNYQDVDGDGAGNTTLVACGGSLNFSDCDDNDPLSLTEAATYYYDIDNDGFGWIYEAIVTCFPPNGYVSNSDDCQPYLWTYEDLDFDGTGNGNLAACGTLINDDCDDNDPSIGNGEYFFADADVDGYVNLNDGYFGCEPTNGYAVYSGSELQIDCNDGDADILGQNLFLYDGDNDGFGTFSISYMGCIQTNGYVLYVEGESQPDCNDNALLYLDADYDGFGVDVLAGCGVLNMDDCDDQYATINPNVQEVCNEIDDDCDVEIDEFVQSEYYADMDGDGFGDINNTTYACDVPTGYVTNIADCDDAMITYEDMDGDGFGSMIPVACGADNNTDCDDQSINTNPGAAEICNSIDDNCSGATDEGVLITYYVDNDGDGFGDASITTLNCSAPLGFVPNADDCDDLLSTIYPGAVELCNYMDEDCDGVIDEEVKNTYYADADMDGYGDINDDTLDCSAPAGYVVDATDCNDLDILINPAGVEVCNEVDDDCDLEIDEFVQTEFYADVDGDSFGDVNNTVYACTLPVGYVTNADDCDDSVMTYEDMDGDGFGSEILVPCGLLDHTDCDDAAANTNPGGIEICNYIDDNCSGMTDEGVQTAYYMDADADGFGDLSIETLDCVAPTGYVSDATDCSDLNAMISPAGIEVCNEVDDDCDNEIDEFVQTEFYADGDGDGFGDINTTTYACTVPVGYVMNANDCDDNLVTYEDLDGDGYGNANTVSCGVELGGDCDDTNDAINAGAVEVCNEVDDNCNIEVDEFVLNTYFADADGDSFGDVQNAFFACIEPVGYVSNSEDCDDSAVTYEDLDADGYGTINQVACGAYQTGDCNDNNVSVNPGESESCNDVDDDCDGALDNGLTFVIYYTDADGDDYGTVAATTSCTDPGAGFSVNTGDCDDADADINPGATEVAGNDVDEDCDGIVGIEEILAFAANVYPNPSTGDLNVVWSQQQDVMWQVLDMSGRVVERGNVKGQSQLKLSGIQWESGVYHVVLTLNNGNQKTLPWMLQK